MYAIDISGLDKAAVLVALFTQAKPPIGMAARGHSLDEPLSIAEANEIFSGHTAANPYTGQPYKLDYVKGRKLKVDLSSDELDPTQYDKANGQGSAMQAINSLRGQPPFTRLLSDGRVTDNPNIMARTPEGEEYLAYSGASDLWYDGPNSPGFYSE